MTGEIYQQMDLYSHLNIVLFALDTQNYSDRSSPEPQGVLGHC